MRVKNKVHLESKDQKRMNSSEKLSQNWEKLYVCTRKQSKENKTEDEQNVLADFKKLDFLNNPCNDSSDAINYNEGKEANMFDKIAKYYGRKKNVFLFISILKNEELSKKIVDIISEKCDGTQQAKFIERATLYLTRVKQGEIHAKDFLNNDSFPDAFFNGYHCGDKINIHENLNVNFTQPTLPLETGNIFDVKIDQMNEEDSELRRVKIYDNGRRSATIEKELNKVNYSFSNDSSCQLIVNRIIKNESWTISLDIISGEVVNLELKIDGKDIDSRKVTDLSMDSETILIKQKSFYEVLMEYLNREEEINRSSYSEQDECLPIKTMEDMYNWKPCTHKHITEHLRKRKQVDDQPKTLVCHDMRGGYLEDRFINGVQAEDPYFFVHWAALDIFVYFSHHLVTIPPCSWITAGHRNGVKVLGTFITEWNEGARICDEFLKDEKSVLQMSMQLVNIAVHHNFDGWLINIENRLKACQIPLLRKFLCYLTTRMHSFCPGSQVIWYDSVIKNGDLQWQNALNDSNRMFFLGCDGIFLNYNWKEEDLKQSVEQAGPRKTDVFVGVDVFGRGCLGGGGFSTKIAVTEARKFGLSVAIFAPGWVHECLEVKDFKENQFKFWGELQGFSSPRTMEELPYSSSFCPGFGKQMYRDGKVISYDPWYSLNLQQPQPIYSSSNEGTVSLYDKDAYNGGGCLCLSGEIINEGIPLEFRILRTYFEMKSTYVVRYAYKPLVPNVDIFLNLEVLSDRNTFNLHLVGHNFKHSKNCDNSTIIVVPTSRDGVLKSGYKGKGILFEEETWINRIYVLNPTQFNGTTIQSISVKLDCISSSVVNPVSVLLGELEITPLSPMYSFAYKDLTCKYDSGNKRIIKVQCVLHWKYPSTIPCSDLYLRSADGIKHYICTTSQFCYKFDTSVCLAPEVEVILCPQSSGGESIPCASLKIPLEINLI